MATQNKITELIAAIKTIYPYYAKEADVVTLVKTWSLLLKDYPDEVVDVALYKALQTCKMPPTPADILEHIHAMIKSTEPTDEELWEVLLDALRKGSDLLYAFNFTAVEPDGETQGDKARRRFQALWDGLPEKLKQYMGGKGEFIRMAQSREDRSFEKNRFMKTMPTLQKRNEYIEMRLTLSGGNATGFLTD